LEEETVLYHDDSHIADVKGNGQNMLVATQCKSEDNDAYDDQMKEDARIVSKPKMALFEGEDDVPMAPQHSTIIFKKNSNVSNISTSIDLSKKNMRDQPFMKLRDFYIDLNHVKEVEDSILPSKLIFE